MLGLRRPVRHTGPVPASSSSPLPPLVAVVGYTASGKTALSLELAEALGGEIVNTDAMAVYRGMDIGTAKPSPLERSRVPHHLLDLLEVTEPLTVAEFQGLARERIERLRAVGRAPVLVGGSALYIRAVLDRFEFPGTDPALRAAWEARLERDGATTLHRLLAERDPEAAASILPENGRRIVRALEVIELTGRRFSATLPRHEYVAPNTHQIGLAIDREVLDARIDARVRRMFEDGFVAEVERLLERGLAEGRTASRAIGYPEVMAHLRDELSLEEAIERTATATRRFARRQAAWWRKDDRITWIGHDDPDLVERAVRVVRR